MATTPVVQVRLSGERLEFLDSLPGTRSEAVRHCIDFTRDAHTTPVRVQESEPASAAPRSAYRFTEAECSHPYEARGRCLGCGRVR